eukprot:PhF_6_TR28982/c0_g1_i1/m.42247
MKAASASVFPIFQSSHFKTNFLITALLTAVINYYIDRNTFTSPTYPLRSTEVYANIVTSNIIFVMLVIPGSADIRNKIRSGVLTGVTPSALQQGIWALFPVVTLTTWYVRIIGLVATAVMFPAAVSALVIRAVCGGLLPQDATCEVSTQPTFLLVTVAWKVFCVLWIFILNYVNSHNVEHPDVVARPAAEAKDSKKTQ